MAEVTEQNVVVKVPVNNGKTVDVLGIAVVNTETLKTEFKVSVDGNKTYETVAVMEGSSGDNFSNTVRLTKYVTFFTAAKQQNKRLPEDADRAEELRSKFNQLAARPIKQSAKAVAEVPEYAEDIKKLQVKHSNEPFLSGITVTTSSGSAQRDTDTQPSPQETLGATGINGENVSEDPFQPLTFESKGMEFGKKFGNVSALVYPESLRDLGQDYVKFRTYRYKPQTITSEYSFKSAEYSGASEGPVIYLPTSGGVQDNNTVSWGPNNINPLQTAMFKEAYGLIRTNNVEGQLKDLGERVRNLFTSQSGNLATATATYFASQAAGVNNLLARTSGAIFNPNLTLLFNNPELRSFSFRYRLCPRDEPEAIVVRRIIRWFKQSMAVRRAEGELFLLTPNVYNISYHSRNSGDNPHKAIGRVKTCALVGCSVNYVPDGAYMTFDDSANTMTSYEISLSFNELDPVYYDQYDDIPNDEIGY